MTVQSQSKHDFTSFKFPVSSFKFHLDFGIRKPTILQVNLADRNNVWQRFYFFKNLFIRRRINIHHAKGTILKSSQLETSYIDIVSPKR